MVALRAALGSPAPERRLVITPAYTFTATACAIEWAGLEPLLVDVDPVAWQLDPAQLRSALAAHEGKVAGVLATSTFGTAAPSPVRRAWREACAEHRIPLVLDSAPGFGAEDEQRRLLGGLGDTEVFSFHAHQAVRHRGGRGDPDRRPGDRGAGRAADQRSAWRRGRARAPRWGSTPSSPSCTRPWGWPRSTGSAAVLGERRRLASELGRRLRAVPLAYQASSAGSTWQCFQALAPDAATRKAVHRRGGRPRGRDAHAARPGAAPAAGLRRRARHGELAVTDDLAARSLSLPLANTLTDAELDRIAAVAAHAQETTS